MGEHESLSLWARSGVGVADCGGPGWMWRCARESCGAASHAAGSSSSGCGIGVRTQEERRSNVAGSSRTPQAQPKLLARGGAAPELDIEKLGSKPWCRVAKNGDWRPIHGRVATGRAGGAAHVASPPRSETRSTLRSRSCAGARSWLSAVPAGSRQGASQVSGRRASGRGFCA